MILTISLIVILQDSNNNNALQANDDIAFWGFVLSAIGVMAALLALWPYIEQKIKERRIRSGFGADLYLKEVIQDASRLYIRPDASSVDLAQEIEERSNRVPTREDLFKAVGRFLDDNSEFRYMLLLADSGMGKSAFVLNYYAYNKRRFARKRYRLAIIPLGHAKAIQKVKEIQEKNDTTIFLDAFDEDPKARSDYWKRLRAILAECSEFRRVLITCRTQFFPKNEAVPDTTMQIKVGPRDDEAYYKFWRLYIAPFSDPQVNKYLSRRFRFNRKKREQAAKVIKTIPLLTIRPMVLANVPDIIAAKVDIKYSWELYELMIRAWYKREHGWWPNTESIQTFSEEIAVRLYRNYAVNNQNYIPRAELADFIKRLPVPVEEWNATSRSLLHRDAEGNFKFAHRSMMEYLFIKRFVLGDKRCMDVEWSDQMQTFLWEMFKSFHESMGELPFFIKTYDKMIPITYTEEGLLESFKDTKLHLTPITSMGLKQLINLMVKHLDSLSILPPLLYVILDPSRVTDMNISLLKCDTATGKTISPYNEVTHSREGNLRATFTPISDYYSPVMQEKLAGRFEPGKKVDVLTPVEATISGSASWTMENTASGKMIRKFSDLPDSLIRWISPNAASVIVFPIMDANKFYGKSLSGLLVCQSLRDNYFTAKHVTTIAPVLKEAAKLL